MFEFRWILPSPTNSHEVTLAVHARRSWFGPKVLRLDGQPIYRRGFFSGIDHVFRHPDDPGSDVELRLTWDGTAEWVPRLTCGALVLQELSGSRPPAIIKPPTRLVVVTGLTYLLMFMAGVTLPSIVTILEALWGEGGLRPHPGYAPVRDIYAWGIPLAATAVCLLGFWNMRRWGVWALAMVVFAEGVGILAFHVSLSWMLVAWQIVLLAFGAASYRKMQ